MPEFSESFNQEYVAKPLWRQQVFGGYEVEEKYDDLYYQKVDKFGDLIVKIPYKIETKTRSERYWYFSSEEILFETRGDWLEAREGYSNGSSIFDSNADLYAYGFNVQGAIKSFSVIWIKPLQEWLKQHRHLCKANESSTGNSHKTQFAIVKRNDIPSFLFFPLPGYKFMSANDEINAELRHV